MARPKKQGLEYYTIQTDIFQNRKIRKFLRVFGAKGYLVYSYLITEIYRDKGYFLSWDEDTAFDVSDILNLKENLVNEIVDYCCNVGLFNKELRNSENILTTKNIQEFWQSVSTKANRSVKKVCADYDLISAKEVVNNEESTLTIEESTVNHEESTQSKVKESKENNIKDVLVGFVKEISNNEHAMFRETFYLNYKLRKGSLSKILELFNNHLILQEKPYSKLSDYKRHFLNWMNVQEAQGKLTDYKNQRKTGL